MSVRRVAYTFVAIDIFHYGHLRLLQAAKQAGDLHVCGLLSDEVCRDWNGNLVMTYPERLAILKALSCVDEVVEQKGMDPTENLRKLHERFPDAELILFQGHQEWQGMPGTAYVRSIGGSVIKPEFYGRLSRRFIREELSRTHRAAYRDADGYILGNFEFFGPASGTKAHTLRALQPLLTKSRIERIFAFTVAQWRAAAEAVLDEVLRTFGGLIVVRSSSAAEDSLTASQAGVFHSELGVDAGRRDAVRAAIERVCASYGDASSPERDQVLIQPHTQRVALSGVVFTRNLQTNAPYYVVNYDRTSATNTVTSGLAGRKVEIARNLPAERVPPQWRGLLEAIREIEKHLDGLVLDIEFAVQDDGAVVIFQVRPLAANARFDTVPDAAIVAERARAREAVATWQNEERILGADLILSDMSFWNPAEIIGDRSANLDYGLYLHLLLRRAWNEGLRPLGYRAVEGPLMLRVANKAYIHVTRAFASLLPASLDDRLVRKLLDAYLDQLRSHPELHDKIEFEIVHNAFTPRTDGQLKALEGTLAPSEIAALRAALIAQTRALFEGAAATIAADRADLARLAEERGKILAAPVTGDTTDRIARAMALLDSACRWGTPQFTRVARMAFVGNQYLKGLVARDALTAGDAESFAASVETVASELDADMTAVIEGRLGRDAFVARYGHLRPGSYDITKLPYAKDPHYFSAATGGDGARVRRREEGSPADRCAGCIATFLSSFPIPMEPGALLHFVAETTRCRELFKFEFTKNLSAAIELLAEAGDRLGFDRPSVACLSMGHLRAALEASDDTEIRELWGAQVEGARARERLFGYLALPALVFGANDLDVVVSSAARPNFISSSRVTAGLVEADHLLPEEYDTIRGALVLLEKADPGYDWIFSRSIAGLITKFGGVASHMAIRCAEFRIPAAIGCGEMIFNRLRGRQLVELDCQHGTITAIR